MKIAYCPNNECLSESVSQEESDSGCHYISCHGCSMEGPVGEDADEAVLLWNGLPREAYEDDKEETNSPTIATLVRMLDETRTFHETLKTQYMKLEDDLAIANKKKEAIYAMFQQCKASERQESKENNEYRDAIHKALVQLKQSPAINSFSDPNLGNIINAYRVCVEQAIKDLDPKHFLHQPVTGEFVKSYAVADALDSLRAMTALDEMIMPLSGMKDIKLYGKDVVPKLEEKIKELKAKSRHAAKKAADLQTQVASLGHDLKIALADKHQASRALKDHRDTLSYIDREVTRFGINPDSVDLNDLLVSVRNSAWKRQDKTILDEVIATSSYYGTCSDGTVYRAAVAATCLTGDERKDAELSVMDMVMNHYSQGSRMYTIAWDALGRPGETKHDGRLPRT